MEIVLVVTQVLMLVLKIAQVFGVDLLCLMNVVFVLVMDQLVL